MATADSKHSPDAEHFYQLFLKLSVLIRLLYLSHGVLALIFGLWFSLFKNAFRFTRTSSTIVILALVPT